MTPFKSIIGRAASMLCLILVFTFPAFASDETIEPGSWVYPALRNFELAGLVELDPELPWSRSQVETYIDRILDRIGYGKTGLTSRQEYLLARLRSEFQGMESRPAERENPPLWCLKEGSRFAALDVAAGGFFRKKPLREKGEADGLAVPSMTVDLGGGLTMAASYRLRLEPEWDSNMAGDKPSGRERSFRGLTSDYERGYISLSRGRWRLMVGRDWIQWGPARDEGLILSSTAGSLDQISAEASIGRFTLTAVHAVLDPYLPRRLSGHRLVTRLPRGIMVGVSETVLYTGRGIDFSYLLPLGAYYANQYNERGDDNVLWSVDLKIPLREGIIFLGELLIDDFQYEGRGKAPDRLGLNLTIEAMPRLGRREIEIHASYTYIDIYTYAHEEESVTRYVAGTGDQSMFALLGSPLGPDSDRWRLRISWPPHPRIVLTGGMDITRRGEGNDLREWDITGDPDPEFPSGDEVTEKDYFLQGLLDMGKGSFISAGIGFQSISPETDDSRGYGHFGIILDF